MFEQIVFCRQQDFSLPTVGTQQPNITTYVYSTYLRVPEESITIFDGTTENTSPTPRKGDIQYLKLFPIHRLLL